MIWPIVTIGALVCVGIAVRDLIHTRRDLRNCTACWEHERRQHEEWHETAAELRLIIEEKDLQIAELRAVAAGRPA